MFIHVLRIVSRDKILHFKNTVFIIIVVVVVVVIIKWETTGLVHNNRTGTSRDRGCPSVMEMGHKRTGKLQALVYDILPSTTAVFWLCHWVQKTVS